jgi:hypothetical protein
MDAIGRSARRAALPCIVSFMTAGATGLDGAKPMAGPHDHRVASPHRSPFEEANP